MAIGYLSPSATKTQGMSYDALLYCKTNIAGYFFDGFMRVEHSRELELTENPVETGAAIVDHAYVKPSQLEMEIMMSDVHQSYVPGQFTEGPFRSNNAWKILRKLQEDRIPFSVFTKLGLYDNMLITRLTATEDSKSYRGLSAIVTLREIPVARVKKVAISSASQTTDSTQMGKVESVTTDSKLESILDSWFDDD